MNRKGGDTKGIITPLTITKKTPTPQSTKGTKGANKPNIATGSKETVFGIPLYETDIIVTDPQQAGEILKNMAV